MIMQQWRKTTGYIFNEHRDIRDRRYDFYNNKACGNANRFYIGCTIFR